MRQGLSDPPDWILRILVTIFACVIAMCIWLIVTHEAMAASRLTTAESNLVAKHGVALRWSHVGAPMLIVPPERLRPAHRCTDEVDCERAVDAGCESIGYGGIQNEGATQNLEAGLCGGECSDGCNPTTGSCPWLFYDCTGGGEGGDGDEPDPDPDDPIEI